ncbi:hypothetical protein A6A19_07870 [Actinobacillus delphinicola]|nr:hypothetical protein [Actinobacillus delphinicola]
MKRCIIAGTSIMSPLVFANAALPHVEVLGFTTQYQPFVQAQLLDKQFQLDKLDELNAELSKGLPNNLQQAEAVMRQRINSPNGRKLIEQIEKASTAISQAWQLGVKKSPAIVFIPTNGNPVVVYGQLNVATAVSIYRQRMEKKS